MTETVNNTGRPERIINDTEWKFINQMLAAQCDGASIARHFGMHPDSFYSKVVDKYGEEFGISTFSAYQQIKRTEGLEMLRNKQFELAMTGDKTMLVWLGKQLLKQRDQIEQTISVPKVEIHTLDESEQAEIATAIIALEQHESNDSLPEEPDSDNGQ
jgi:hypothetical protein